MEQHFHFCPECNEYKMCADDCDPIDWAEEEGRYTYPAWPCDDCQKMLSGSFEGGAGI